MKAGEYAVHYSSFDEPSGVVPFCTVFENLSGAEVYAREQIAERPHLRCRIYDHQGFIGAPVREFKGCSFKGEGEISSRFRRWGGSVLFFGGLFLTAIDWYYDFELSWPSIIGMRIVIPGLILLFTEVLFILHARYSTTSPG
jgi:hypothetical protein